MGSDQCTSRRPSARSIRIHDSRNAVFGEVAKGGWLGRAMIGVVTLNNYDTATHLHWFRKVERHPDKNVQSLADAFCETVSSWLGVRPQAVFWFEEADFRQASQAWLQNPSRHDQAADPVREPCEYFRWRGSPGVAFFGYTHRESPLGIMINISRSGADLLDTIAEECFHLHQDVLHGAGWRAAADHATVEGEAREFVTSRTHDIQDFVKGWERAR